MFELPSVITLITTNLRSLLDLGGGVIARRRMAWPKERQHLRPPCKNRWLQRYLPFFLRSIIDRRRVICFYFGQITELLSFFPRTNENNRTIIDFLERCSAVRTKKNKKKSLIGIHTAPDISSSAPPLQISVTFDG